jgi:hypothetical protein
MPRFARCLFLALFPLSLFAAGHDVSAIRYAPSDLPAGTAVAAVAYNGNQFLTLWPMSFHIFGASADASGRSLSPGFAAVPFANTDVIQLTAAGSGYLAIWNQNGTASLGTFNSNGVLERRVPLESEKLVAPRLVFNGTNVLVVDQIGSPTAAIAESVYDLNGRLVSRFLLPVVINESYAVTSNGSDFIVVTAGRSGINERRLASDGTILSTLPILPPPSPPFLSLYDVAVTAKNGRIAIAWEQRQLRTVSSAVIQPDGSVSRSELAAGSEPPWPGVAILPVDTGFFVVWNAQPALSKAFAVRLDEAGVPLDARPFDLGNGPFTAAASSGKVIELTMTALGRRTTLVADVDANGISLRAPAPTAVTPVRQVLPVVAGNGAGFTAAWLERSADSQNAMIGRVNTMGDALDGPGITLGLQTSPPAIAQGSFGQLAVWSASGHLVAARLFPSGAVFDAQPIVIGPSIGSNAVAWSGSRFFVVCTDGRQLFGAFVETDGTTTPPRPLGIQTPLSGASSVDLAWDGRQFIVVFSETTPGANRCLIPEGCGDLPDHISLVRVSADGVAIDTTAVRVPGAHARAHVASSGSESMIALDNDRETSAMIVRDDGAGLQLGPEVPLFRWLNSYGSDIAWNGSQYVVAWRYSLWPAGPGWIGVKTIGQSGVPFASRFTPTAGPPEDFPPYSAPSIAANDSGDAAVVISEIAPASYSARARLYLTSEMAPMPPPPPTPRNVVVYATGTTTIITWQNDGTALGFETERSDDFGRTWVRNGVTGDVRNLTVPSSPRGPLYRVSAFGPGGYSEAAVATIGKLERRRAERN